jgi:hypothetical protein
MHGGMEGGYAYIDSSYPRRPGDFARLSSMEFEATGAETLEITIHFQEKIFNIQLQKHKSHWLM